MGLGGCFYFVNRTSGEAGDFSLSSRGPGVTGLGFNRKIVGDIRRSCGDIRTSVAFIRRPGGTSDG